MQSLQREQLERQAAALATSGAPLAWRGARPRRQDSGLAFPNNGQALCEGRPSDSYPAPGFARVCLTGKWSMQRRAGGGGRRVRGASSCVQSEPAVKTVPRPAPLGPQLAPALTAPFTPSPLASSREAGSRNGEMNWGEGWNPALPGCSGPTALNFGGIPGMAPEEEEKTTPPTRKASSPYPPATWAPGPLPLKRACYQPGVYKVK